jgi:hypothetical protein
MSEGPATVGRVSSALRHMPVLGSGPEGRSSSRARAMDTTLTTTQRGRQLSWINCAALTLDPFRHRRTDRQPAHWHRDHSTVALATDLITARTPAPVPPFGAVRAASAVTG